MALKYNCVHVFLKYSQLMTLSVRSNKLGADDTAWKALVKGHKKGPA